jgi:hypothetical protein
MIISPTASPEGIGRRAAATALVHSFPDYNELLSCSLIDGIIRHVNWLLKTFDFGSSNEQSYEIDLI